jgi:hypothetical protein
MNPKRIELAERRAMLVARAADQRGEIVELLTTWPRPSALMDRGWEAVRNIAGHPAVLAWAAALLLGIGPARTLKWVQQGLLIVRIVSMVLVGKRSLLGR